MAGEEPPLEICYADEVKHGKTTTVGHIKYYRDKFLGKGAFGSVYMGRSSGRDVAVKRIEYHGKEEEKTIGKEIELLLKLDANNANVIRFYTAVRSDEHYLIAMELGVCTVHDYVKEKDKFTSLGIDKVTILRDSSKGLEWLHEKQIMHRDIKPENILLVRDEKDGIVAKLTDFGISKELTSGTQAMTSWKGTLDWMAPEVQESGGQVGSVGAADVFSLGLVFYYVLSKGKHPFSKNDTMTAKVIKSDSACLDDVPKGSMRSLIEEMIQITPGDRPSSKYVARHPTFWEPQKTQLFYQAISDLIMAKDENLKATVDENPTRVFEEQGEQGEPKDWRTIIDKSLDEGSFKSYKDATVSQLLRFIRNKLHHFDEVPEEGRRIVHNTKSGLVNYIADKFPLLLMHVWEAAEIRRDKLDLRDFYSGCGSARESQNTIILPAGVGFSELKELRSSRKTKERLSVTIVDIPRLRGQLPKGLERLTVRGGGIRANPNTIILRAGVPLSELTELRGSRKTVKRLSVTAADLPRLSGQLLPKGLVYLNVRGPEVTEPRWPEVTEPRWPEVTEPRWPGWYWGLSVSLQGVAADTISHLADLGRTVTLLEIYDCPDLTTGSLEPLTRCRELRYLTLSGGVPDTVSLEPLTRCPELQYLSVTPADLPRLRGQLLEGLEYLNVRGPEVTEPRWPGRYGSGLSVSLQGVAADTISHLADLGRTVTGLEIYACPVLTVDSLKPLTRCPKLWHLNLYGSVTDAVSLEPLTRCPELQYLTLSGCGPDFVSLEPLTKCRGLKGLSITAADLPLLRGQLPKGLGRLNVRGPEVTEPRWPKWDEDDGLSVSLQGVTADTISHLADLGRTVGRLEIYDCPDLTAGSLEPITRCRELQRLSVTAADLPLLRGQLPESLECLNVRGPEVTEQRWPGWYDEGLSVSLQGVAADTISHLPDLGRMVRLLEIHDCPDLTAGSLEPLTRCTELRYLSVTAADLPRLRGQLPEGLWRLNVRGPEVTEPRWPEWNPWSDLSVSLQGVTADAISHLADLGDTVKLLYIYDCPDHTAGSLEPLTRCRGLQDLSVSAADLPLLRGQLPEGLRRLNVRGPEVTKSRWPGRYGSGLSVSLQGVAADTISHLATELGSRITLLDTDAQMTAIPSQLRGAIIRVEPNTVILPAGVGDSELTELQISRETVKRLSVSAADLPRLRGQLPEGLMYLNVRGPEVTEQRWPGWYDDGLSVSLQGVPADTISHLPDLGRMVRLLEIYDCPDLTAGRLEPLTRCPELEWLSVTAADLPRLRGQLPEGLWRLNVRGPEVTEPRWPGRYSLANGLSVSLQGVAADTISHLDDLARTVTRLEIYDCPDLTAGSLEPLTRCPAPELLELTLSGGVHDTVSLEPLTRCPGLWRLTLSGGVPDTVSLEPLTRCPKLERLTLSGGVPDAVLDSLSGCPGLWFLTLGDLQRPAETAFTAAAVTRLVKSCRELRELDLHCTEDTGQAVLTALEEADLGRDSDGEPRTIGLYVPEELFYQLESQPGGGVKVYWWED